MIAESEGFVVNNINALEKLYLSSGSDIRHVINALQTWRMRTSELKYDEVSSEISHGEKDSSVRQTRYSIYLLY
jgi:DNA polymerase III delta prime subunit